MSRQLFYNGRVYRDHRFETLCVLSENGVITEIGEWISAPEAERIDLKGRRLVPGFLDIHTHGAAGVDVNSADPDGYEKISRFMASQGTTGWVLCSQIRRSRHWPVLKHINSGRAWNTKAPP
jgi:N-acetylglucosamine-6-phosphate deacetylase